jgi:excisionase family DNA binding protein
MQLLTAEQAAQRLNISVKTVYQLVAKGLLPCVRPSPGGRTIRIHEEDLSAYLAACRRDQCRPSRVSGLKHIKMPTA